MKRFVISVVIMLFVGVFGFSQIPFSDVPLDHWAYEAVRTLLEAGVVSGMPDGTYDGNSNATRYQIAVYLYRAIEYLKSDLPYLKAESMAEFINQLDNMRSLVDSVAKNAENLGSEYSKLYNQVQALKNDVDEMGVMKTTFNTLSSRITTIENSYSSLKSDVTSLQGTVAGMNSKVINLENNIRGFESSISALQRDVSQDKQNIANMQADFKSLQSLLGGVNVLEVRSQVNRNTGEITQLRSDLTAVNDLISPLDARVTKNENDTKTLNSKFSALDLYTKNLGARADGLETSLTSLSADYEGFKSDILTRVSKNSSDILNHSRQIQDLELRMDAQYQELSKKVKLPTYLAIGGIVLGAGGVALGVINYLNAKTLYDMVNTTEGE